jgi:hypothetical protein
MNIIVIKSTEDELVVLNIDHIESIRLYTEVTTHLLKVKEAGSIGFKTYTIDYETWHEVARMLRFQWSKLL